MMRNFYRAFLTACMVAVLGVVGAMSQADDKDGWVTIFDGKNLDGWKVNENPNSIKLENGLIVTHGERSHLFYVGDKKPFKNFEFLAEVMTKPNSNSGIFIHTEFQDTGWPAKGYECQVNNTYAPDPQKTGGLYNTVKVLKAPAEDDKWFNYYVKVEGKHVIVKIDDKVVVDYTEPADKAGPVKLSEGTFALQAHDPKSTVMYRSVKVKRLAD
ncbi:MAG: 3-keto-disaccharide hydrolase [Planctomycetaceae bacterium]